MKGLLLAKICGKFSTSAPTNVRMISPAIIKKSPMALVSDSFYDATSDF